MQTMFLAALLLSLLAVTRAQDAGLLAGLIKQLEREEGAPHSPASVDDLVRSIRQGGEQLDMSMEETLGRILDAQVVAVSKRSLGQRQNSGFVCAADTCANNGVCSTTDKPQNADFMCYCQTRSGYAGLRCELQDPCFKKHKFPVKDHKNACTLQNPDSTLCIPSSIRWQGFYCL